MATSIPNGQYDFEACRNDIFGFLRDNTTATTGVICKQLITNIKRCFTQISLNFSTR